MRNLRVATYLLSNGVTLPVSRGETTSNSTYATAVHITSVLYSVLS